ncbi:MAG: adenylate/guanylate cyclase domain-containing protein [Rhodospirillales bacterium]|nr:adenylate/guanylate cyclase domain-containing protein [Rhodospirillales bacterium]
MTDTRLEARRGDRLLAAFRAEELAGLKLAAQARLVALVVVAVWLFVWTKPPRTEVLEVLLVVFALLGLAHYRLRRRRPDWPWLGYIFVVLDFGLLAFSTLGLETLLDEPWPPQMALRNGTVVYFFVFVGLMALSYRPRLMLWSGFVGALAWSGGAAWLVAQPGSLPAFVDREMSAQESLALHLDPRFVDTGVWQQNVIVLLLVAGILAVAGWRGKRLVQRQAEAERERGNLARHFSPNMVDQLAGTDEALGAVRSQPVAVLFADIVGFTQVSEALPPERVIELLREFHGRMSRAVFENEGTVDKFIGDAIMATFGTPFTGPADAANAVACARAMVGEAAAWNRQRWAAGHTPIQIGIGAHYGPAVLGDIGSERRLEFAVVGDTVNVASRLEGLTRGLGVDIALSDELARQVELEDRDEVLDGFARGRPQQLKNREKPLVVWIWRGA